MGCSSSVPAGPNEEVVAAGKTIKEADSKKMADAVEAETGGSKPNPAPPDEKAQTDAELTASVTTVPSKHSRVLVVGGGPAGIHMASRLRRMGYEKVTVLEKNACDGHFGKSHSHKRDETGDVPHEMGTCYLSWSYKHVSSLISEYLGAEALIEPGGGIKDQYGALHLPSPKFDQLVGKQTVTSDRWLFAYRELLTTSKCIGDILPDKLQAVGFLADICNYRKLHEELMGSYDYHGLPPRPNAERLEKLNMTFGELLRKNGLAALLDLCCVGFGSYGLGYDVPALYGLWFVTPPAVDAYIMSKLDSKIKTVQLVKTGFSSLWARMVEKDAIDVRYDVDIKGIDRSTADPSKPITVTCTVGGKEEVIEGDFLVFAAPTQHFTKVVQDATSFEREVVGGLTSVGLVVNLFKTAKKPPIQVDGDDIEEVALTFYPESLQPQYTPTPCGQVYAERNNIRAYAWEKEEDYKDRYVMTYQYYPKPVEDAEAATKAAIDFITDANMVITPTPSEPAPELLYHKNWDYFPHFTQDAVNGLMPWRVFDNQGMNRTWLIGSSVSFESTEDVCKYNLMLLESKGLSADGRAPPDAPGDFQDKDTDGCVIS